MILPLLLTIASTMTAPCTIGNWTFKASEQPLFRFAIDSSPAGTTAIWERPENFEMDGDSFSRIRGPVIRRAALSAKTVNGDAELSFDDPRPGATPDIFRLHCVGSDHLDVTYEGTGTERFDFVKTKPNAPPLGPWDAGRSYVNVVVRPTNIEMTAIFDADQADRRAKDIDWSIVGPADKKRRARTEELLDAGALQSGEDYYNAAFVFQHGGVADDYLKAHLLAMIAMARGKPGAVWIASATLDRYLQHIGKPQVLGTQYMIPRGSPATQEPYDRALVSDAMRKALHVPPLAEQDDRRRQYTEEALGQKKP